MSLRQSLFFSAKVLCKGGLLKGICNAEPCVFAGIARRMQQVERNFLAGFSTSFGERAGGCGRALLELKSFDFPIGVAEVYFARYFRTAHVATFNPDRGLVLGVLLLR